MNPGAWTRRGLAALPLVVAFALTAQAQSFEDGVAAYERGDYATAFKIMKAFADQGDASAQFNLGLMYANGQGMTQDYGEAHKWFNLAAANLPPGENRDLAVKNRIIVEAKMTSAQVAEAQRLAREWKPK